MADVINKAGRVAVSRYQRHARTYPTPDAETHAGIHAETYAAPYPKTCVKSYPKTLFVSGSSYFGGTLLWVLAANERAHNTFNRALLVHSKVCSINGQRYCVNVKLAASRVFVGVVGFWLACTSIGK